MQPRVVARRWWTRRLRASRRLSTTPCGATARLRALICSFPTIWVQARWILTPASRSTSQARLRRMRSLWRLWMMRWPCTRSTTTLSPTTTSSTTSSTTTSSMAMSCGSTRIGRTRPLPPLRTIGARSPSPQALHTSVPWSSSLPLWVWCLHRMPTAGGSLL